MTIDRQFSLDGNDPRYNCKCVSKHVPRALELHKHHVWPLGEGGPDARENLVILCPTSHSNVHRLWRLYEQYNGRPPWDILRNYSEYARAIVEKGRNLRTRARAAGEGNTNPLLSSSPSSSGTKGIIPIAN
jgi:5-methylcytosine-specific restriction endonuclease McrA